MRDNHEGYPELRDAYERDGLYFGVIRISVSNETASLEFGVERAGYTAIKRIIQTRPFDITVGGGGYRYFFTGSFSRRNLDQEPVTIYIRIEQGNTAKNFEFDCPTSLASNLLWFTALTEMSQAAALKRVAD